ncbi:MAG: trypsin-like peptidase domain-containing protein [Planctomycetes bacterium]|nr:trypsin-like peptidase domain-containing protein [Planctomycetota bacterium]
MLKRILLIIILGILGIGLTVWATKPAELPPDVIIIRPLSTKDNPYQREYDEMLKPAVMITTLSGRGTGVIIPGSLVHQSTGSLANEQLNNSTVELYVLTAAHVVGNYAKVEVTFYDYSHEGTKSLSASVVITDTVKDLALLSLKTDNYNLKTAALANRDYKYYLFAPVYVVGCSLGLNPRPSSGIVSAISFDSVEITAPILPGNSGGPVYTADTHELIGIAVWVRLCGNQLVTTMAGIVPISEIYDFLDSAPCLTAGTPYPHTRTPNYSGYPRNKVEWGQSGVPETKWSGATKTLRHQEKLSDFVPSWQINHRKELDYAESNVEFLAGCGQDGYQNRFGYIKTEDGVPINRDERPRNEVKGKSQTLGLGRLLASSRTVSGRQDAAGSPNGLYILMQLSDNSVGLAESPEPLLVSGREDTTMSTTRIWIKLAINPLTTAVPQMAELWANGLSNNAGKLIDRLQAVIPDEVSYLSRLAEPAQQEYQKVLDPSFISRKGKNKAKINTTQAYKIKKAWTKYLKNLNFMFETIDGVVAKRFKDKVDSSKEAYAERLSETTLSLTGIKSLESGPARIAVYWLTGDSKAKGLMRASDEYVVPSEPFNVTTVEKRNSLRALVMSRLIQSGMAIMHSSLSKPLIDELNLLDNSLVQGMIDPALGLESFAPGGASHLDFVKENGQLFLEVKVSQV